MLMHKIICLTITPQHFSCDSIDKLKNKLPLLEKDIGDSTKFKDFYQFTFNYAKNPGKLWPVSLLLFNPGNRIKLK